MKKQSKFIVLHKEKPHKVFKINIKHSQHIGVFCKFLHDNEDKKMEIILNGKSIVFTSLADKKRFANGFEQASRIVSEIKTPATKIIQPVVQNNTADNINKYATVCALAKIRVETLQDKMAELESDRQILLETIETLRRI